MTVEPLGEAALILRDLPIPAPVAAHQLRGAWPGIEDVVPVFDEIGIYFEAGASLPTAPEIEDRLYGTARPIAAKTHLIPVCYELADDEAQVARMLGLPFEQIVQAHASLAYECRAIGFCPGFAYLTELPPSIAGLPRMASPRLRVEPGSVALAGNMTAVYPLVRPGGWWIIGRTPLTLVDEEQNYFPIRVGDSVRFSPIAKAEFEARRGERL
jgi:inhibitor of KinA